MTRKCLENVIVILYLFKISIENLIIEFHQKKDSKLMQLIILINYIQIQVKTYETILFYFKI